MVSTTISFHSTRPNTTNVWGTQPESQEQEASSKQQPEQGKPTPQNCQVPHLTEVMTALPTASLFCSLQRADLATWKPAVDLRLHLWHLFTLPPFWLGFIFLAHISLLLVAFPNSWFWLSTLLPISTCHLNWSQHSLLETFPLGNILTLTLWELQVREVWLCTWASCSAA